MRLWMSRARSQVTGAGGEDVGERALQLAAPGLDGGARQRGDASGQGEGRVEPQLEAQSEDVSPWFFHADLARGVRLL